MFEKIQEINQRIRESKERTENKQIIIEDYKRLNELLKELENIYKRKELLFPKAREMFEELKETELWDRKRKQWNWYMDMNGKLKDSNRHSDIQLLGILVEAIVGDREEARRMFEELKKTELWDEERRQWNERMTNKGELESDDRPSDAQLLGILVEAFFENPDEFINSLFNISS